MERSLEKFRKPRNPWKQRDAQTVSDEQLEYAIQTGIQDIKTESVDTRFIKDKANTVSSWIECNKNRLNLSGKEEETFRSYKEEIHRTFNDAKYVIMNRTRYIQLFKDSCYKYFEYGQILQNPIERFYFNKNIHPLTPQEIQEKNNYFDRHYDFKLNAAADGILVNHMTDTREIQEANLPDDHRKLRIEIKVYNKVDSYQAMPRYHNVVNLGNYCIEGWDNDNHDDILGPNRMHLSDIKFQTLRKALEWLKNTDEQEFEQYRNLSLTIDNFQPRSLSGHAITHHDTENTVSQAIEKYKSKKQDTGQSLTEEEKNGTFVFPADSHEFKQIALETTVGKEKLFFLRNYFPDLYFTGIALKTDVTDTIFHGIREMRYYFDKKQNARST